MKKLISAHSHLLTDPRDLDFFVGKFSQIWLLGLPVRIKVPGYSRPAGEEELLAAAKQFPGILAGNAERIMKENHLL